MTSPSGERHSSLVPKFLITFYSVLAVMALSSCWLFAPRAAYSQDLVELVTSQARIPQGRYKTWSLFLVCNPEWLEPGKGKDLYSLYEHFNSFGRAIGGDNLAVWFWKTRPMPDDPNLAEDVDVERAARICASLQLKPSSGPHLAIMESYPDESNLPKPTAVYELGQMTAADISHLLAKLTDQLVLNGHVTQDPLWVRLLAATQRLIGSFGCTWNFKVETGIVSADLRSCGTQ